MSQAIVDQFVRCAHSDDASSHVLHLEGSSALGIANADMAVSVNAENFEGLAVAKRVSDLLNPAPDVEWQWVRTEMTAALEAAAVPDKLLQLYERMRSRIDRNVGRNLDLTFFCDQAATSSLIPTIIEGLAAWQRWLVQSDIELRFKRMQHPRQRTLDRATADFALQILAGFAVRSALARRLRDGQRHDDVAQAVLRLVEKLGLVRATYAVTTALTAISGAPGSTSACLTFELAQRPDWAARLRKEQSRFTPERYIEAIGKDTPLTTAFVKEVLRMWSFPLLAGRVAMKPLKIGAEELKVGDRYLLCPYVAHRDQRVWRNADEFDPDRWLTDRRSKPKSAYVPFGWSPRSCVGASLGFAQLHLFVRLATFDFDLNADTSASRGIELRSIAIPGDFRGTFTRR